MEQQSIPGINANKYAYDAILSESPCPETTQQAESFFRKYCIATITQKKDHDYLRVVLKDTDLNENKEKHEYSKELPIDNKKSWNEGYIEIAQKAHAVWLDLIGPKYLG